LAKPRLAPQGSEQRNRQVFLILLVAMLACILVLTIAIVRNERALNERGLSSFNPIPPPSPIDFAALNLTGPIDPFLKYEIRVNAGGARFTDRYGYVWDADNGFVGGQTFRTEEPIAGTKESSIYQTERYSSNTNGFWYRTAVPSGRYVVSLYFAEVYDGTFAPGARVFDVAIENKTVLEDFDIYAIIGPNAALERSFLVNVTDGELEIHFVRGFAENPKVNALSAVRVE
jgi:hypothetical protein